MEFLLKATEKVALNKETIEDAIAKADADEQLTFKDTIQIVCELGSYTLIEYSKGGADEWCVALNYNTETKSWDSGHYCYSLEHALATLLLKNNSELVKSPREAKAPVNYDRMSELATLFKDGLIEDDRETAMEYFTDTCEMTAEEMEYFGIESDGDDDEI